MGIEVFPFVWIGRSNPSRSRRHICRARNGLACIAIGLMVGGTTPETLGAQQAASADPQAVDTIRIVGTHDRYRASTLRSLTRTPTSLMETPQGVTIVTRDIIADHAMTGMGELVRYVPGVTMAQGEGHRDAPVLRGNVSTADFFVDGVRDDLQYLRDLYNVERVDVIAGPSALAFGRGTGGGAINRVTKAADGQRVRAVDLLGSGFGQARVAGDLGGAAGDRLAWRLNAVAEQGGAFRDAMAIGRRGVAPAARLRLGAATSLDLQGEVFADDRTVDRGVPSVDGGPWRGDVTTFFGNPAWSRSRVDVATARATLEHPWRDDLTLRAVLAVGDHAKFYDNVFPGGPINAADRTLPIAAYRSATDRVNVLSQLDLVWTPRLGGRRHTVLVAVEGGRQRSDNTRINAAGTITSLLDRGRTFVPDFDGAPALDNGNDLRLLALVAQDQFPLTDRLSAIAGLRWDRFALRFDDRRPTAADFARTDAFVSPRLGLVWTPRPAVALFGGWSAAALPQSGEQFNLLDASRAGLAPERFANVEVGVRVEPRDALLVSATLYRLDRTNTIAPGPTAGLVVPTGAQRAEGLELAVQGELTPRWRTIGALAVQDARITATTRAAPAGRRTPLVPRFSASWWNRVTPHPRLGVALGVIHQGAQFASITNAVTLPSYTRLDGALSLDLTAGLRLQVNAENLSGTRYWFTAHTDDNLSPGAPTLVRVGLALRR